jgi:hypothetical protein
MKKLYIYAFTGLILLGFGCKKLDTFGDTNTDPGNTQKPVLSALMTTATGSIGTIASTSVAADTNITKTVIPGVTTPGIYAQYFAESQYNDVTLYSLQRTSFTTYYSTVLSDLQNIITANESNNMTQVARILQQYVYWTITDRWGDIPYTEALKGLDNLHPKYDKQEDIYRSMSATIKTAIAAFDNSTISGDVLYNGDVPSWKRLGNSLRLLMALQLSKRFPAAGAYAATEFNAALTDAGGYITTNAQNFTAVYPGGSFPTPWYTTYNGRKDLGESKTMTDLMASLSDTRQNVFGGATEQPSGSNAIAPSSTGIPYGLARQSTIDFTDENPNWARVLRGDFRRQAGSVVIISAAEVTLARAEAANRGWTTEPVASVYENGIDLSFAQWGLSAPPAYKSQAAVALGAAGSPDNISKIAIQEFIASYPDGLRAWNIWRRTGYPVLTPAIAAVNASKLIPRRIAYAPDEYSSNKASVEAAVALLPGGDTQDARVWWDQMN